MTSGSSSVPSEATIAEWQVAGQVVTVRPATRDDAASLAALYGRLSVEDRQMRFFTTSVSDSQAERWCGVGELGGLLLLAVVTQSDGEEVVIGEAGYSPRKDGDGELGITVDPAYRGHLGARLFDTLLREAAERGVRNIHAVVRPVNRPMLGLVRQRGVVIADWDEDHMDFVIGTSGATPSWPESDSGKRRPRVLVETNVGRWAGERAAREAGFDVLTCRGPGARHDGCPMLSGDGCSLVDDCDAVVVGFSEGATGREEILDAHRERGDVEVLLARPGSATDDPDLNPADAVEILRRTLGLTQPET